MGGASCSFELAVLIEPVILNAKKFFCYLIPCALIPLQGCSHLDKSVFVERASEHPIYARVSLMKGLIVVTNSKGKSFILVILFQNAKQIGRNLCRRLPAS